MILKVIYSSRVCILLAATGGADYLPHAAAPMPGTPCTIISKSSIWSYNKKYLLTHLSPTFSALSLKVPGFMMRRPILTLICTAFLYSILTGKLISLWVRYHAFQQWPVTPNLRLNMMGFSWVKQERFFPAMHAGYEFMFWRLAIRLQIKAHLSSMGRALKGNTFIRPSVRYNINNRLFAQLGLKTMQGGTADWWSGAWVIRCFSPEEKGISCSIFFI